MKRSRSSADQSTVTGTYSDQGDLLKRFLARFLFDPRDVEDISQEAYLRAFEAEKGQQLRSPRAFLFRVARNLALNELSRKARKITDYIEDAAPGEEPSGPHSLEKQVQDEQRFALFCRAAARLPPLCRRAFLMRKVYGYSHREIADQLGISTSTVEKHISTGLYRCSEFMKVMGGSQASGTERLGADISSFRGNTDHG